jgi:hypothetical protein
MTAMAEVSHSVRQALPSPASIGRVALVASTERANSRLRPLAIWAIEEALQRRTRSG